MPVLKSLPGKLRGSKHSRNLGTPSTAPGALILGTMNGGANPFEEEEGERGDNPFEDKEEEGGGANPFEEEEGGESPARPSPDPLKNEECSSSLRGTLDRIRGVSPLKTLGKLGKGLRSSVRGKGTPGEEKTPSSRLPGKRKESLSNGELSPPEREGGEGDPKRRLSFLKIGLGGKSRRESQAEKLSLEREGERVEEEREGEKEEEKKAKEPLSVPGVKSVCLFQETVTGELSEDLEAEERRWGESLQIEEYQSSMANNVIAKLQIHLDRSSSITAELGARVAHCCLSGLADFLQSFQKKVEVFHQYQTESGNPAEGFTPKTIALCESQCCEEGLRTGMAVLDRIVSLGVKVLVEQLFQQIKPYFEKLVKRKWLNNTEAFDSITEMIKSNFKTFCRMEGPPYQALVCEVHRRVHMESLILSLTLSPSQALVCEVHRRVLVEYLRALMRSRIICTSAKKRRKIGSLPGDSKALEPGRSGRGPGWSVRVGRDPSEVLGAVRERAQGCGCQVHQAGPFLLSCTQGVGGTRVVFEAEVCQLPAGPLLTSAVRFRRLWGAPTGFRDIANRISRELQL
ncbi:Exocyst complex component 3-like protein 2 [Acipenser ruthenus]|uniref:non-specific serine/threonine protein kinase n=1 Tax=Acipenser ruthenus TaxID=7906 RepID=A0A662YMI8_ACIRT|nr:Exocyst complex component 3-like protein 2 [Acipenser ruthenus]